MKYLVSLILCGFLFTSSLIAQNRANNGPRILDQVAVVTGTTEDMATEISSRELAVTENAMRDYSTTIWSREIYRQIAHDVEGNESFFQPHKSTALSSPEQRINLFSMIINLISTNTVHIYKFSMVPDENSNNILKGRDALLECAIPFTENNNRTLNVKPEDIPSENILYYLIKEKWHFDDKTFKGDVRITHICPVLYEKGKFFPLFWVAFDDISTYLTRVESSVAVGTNPVRENPVNVSMFDVMKNRYYRGCIYQVGLRHLSLYYPEMEDLMKERVRIENELDYIMERFYAAERRR
ncbi:MAG: gliding motility protein GldN [Prevotella sp.]|jgi:hypothetical protein|nr:gliding motility protein GldN [Prevotella sp.]